MQKAGHEHADITTLDRDLDGRSQRKPILTIAEHEQRSRPGTGMGTRLLRHHREARERRPPRSHPLQPSPVPVWMRMVGHAHSGRIGAAMTRSPCSKLSRPVWLHTLPAKLLNRLGRPRQVASRRSVLRQRGLELHTDEAQDAPRSPGSENTTRTGVPAAGNRSWANRKARVASASLGRNSACSFSLGSSSRGSCDFKPRQRSPRSQDPLAPPARSEVSDPSTHGLPRQVPAIWQPRGAVPKFIYDSGERVPAQYDLRPPPHPYGSRSLGWASRSYLPRVAPP